MQNREMNKCRIILYQKLFIARHKKTSHKRGSSKQMEMYNFRRHTICNQIVCFVQELVHIIVQFVIHVLCVGVVRVLCVRA
jgi:hypothetical protein